MNKQAIITENNVEWLITYGKDGNEKKRYCLSLDPEVFTPNSLVRSAPNICCATARPRDWLIWNGM